MHQVGADKIKCVLVSDETASLQEVEGRASRHRYVADQLNDDKYGLSADSVTSSDC